MNKAAQILQLSLAATLTSAALCLDQSAGAQDAAPPSQPVRAEREAADGGAASGSPETATAAPTSQAIDEVVTIGRFLSSSQEVANERLNDAAVVDTLGADTIARLGDSTVANALRRIPGLSLVSNKFVYVRGLGERYSSTSLNGAQIPSPDLTRNVIPLDLFPTSVVESLRVQKAWAADLPANFGGGLVDIRTHGIPRGLEFSLELGTGGNSENTGTVFTYRGGADDGIGTDDGKRALPTQIVAALDRFQGNVDVQNILRFLQRADSTATLADAKALNRSLGLSLNRDIAIKEQKSSPDGSLKLEVGDRYDFHDDWQFGFLAGATYSNGWRDTTRKQTNFRFPAERTDTERQSTQSIDISTTLNMGLHFTDDHQISTTSLFLRNTDDQTAVRDYFNENREISDGLGFREYRIEFQERNMRTNQIQGTHYIGDATRDRFPGLTGWLNWLPRETRVAWYSSDSKASTDIPNQVSIASTTVTDRQTTQVLDEAVALQSTAADYRFTRLDDSVRDAGWDLALPLALERSTLELKGGGGHSQKARSYKQSQVSLGMLSLADLGTLDGPVDEVFSDANITNPANDYVFGRQGTNNQSYLAATMTDAAFGLIDWTYDGKYRIAAGVRREDYRQVAVDWNPYGYTQDSPQVTTDPATLQRGTFQSTDSYPSLSLTYMSHFWAPRFQLRLGWSKTAVRPDLREITDASYVDPITEILTRGNSGVVPAGVTNYDIRSEWFFDNRDNFTVTLFSKDIANPIEFFESAASDTTIAREILNAESGNVKGIEIEGLKSLGFLGADIWQSLFLQGNLTLQDSELIPGPRADAPTNPVRKMAGASDYVLNLMLGYDSRNSKHSGALIYNVFGERLYVAGRNGAPDGFEQPFRSLDATYTWFPSPRLTIKAKAQNLLDQTIRIKREGLTTFEEDPGMNLVFGVQWKL